MCTLNLHYPESHLLEHWSNSYSFNSQKTNFLLVFHSFETYLYLYTTLVILICVKRLTAKIEIHKLNYLLHTVYSTCNSYLYANWNSPFSYCALALKLNGYWIIDCVETDLKVILNVIQQEAHMMSHCPLQTVLFSFSEKNQCTSNLPLDVMNNSTKQSSALNHYSTMSGLDYRSGQVTYNT